MDNPAEESKKMNLTFYIPEKIQGHDVGNALVLGAEESNLRSDDVLEIQGGREVKVVLLLTPEGFEDTQSYVAYEWSGQSWVQVELPVFTFDKVSTEKYLAEVSEEGKQVYPDLKSKN